MCEDVPETFVVYSGVKRFRAKSIAWESSQYIGLYDLCLLKTDFDLPSSLVIADRMPLVGEDIGYVGWPLGSKVVAHGKYLGDLDGPDEDSNNSAFSAPCDHGASGSAVFTSRGVWGVLVRLRTDGGKIHDPSEGCVAIPLKQLKEFLDDNKIDYASTPEPVSPY